MAVCLIAANKQDYVTFGYILDCCYRSGALQQPVNFDPPSYFGHIFEILCCFLEMDDIYDYELQSIRFNYSVGYGFYYVVGSFASDRVAWHLTTNTSLEEVLGIQISDFLQNSPHHHFEHIRG